MLPFCNSTGSYLGAWAHPQLVAIQRINAMNFAGELAIMVKS
jgi:hypothetical protein